MDALEIRFIETLREHRARVTDARKEIFDILKRSNEALSLQAIVKQAHHTDRASVYRIISLFEQLHIVNTLLVGWKKRFELAAPFRPHHHHFVCNSCAKVEEIGSAHLEHLISTISQQYSFSPVSHSFEVKGMCKTCQIKKESS